MPPKRGKKQKKPEDHGSDNDSSSDFASALSLQHIEMSPSSASPSTKKTRVADASTSAAGLGLGLAEVAANKVTVKTAELLFPCEFCPRAFGTPSALSAHQRVHKAKPEVAIHPYRVLIDMLHPCSREDHLKKKNCSGNPWCVYGYAKEREEGIWRKDKSNPTSAPTILRIRDEATGALHPPAGLKNLGTTCYINALLQCLFQNLLFRDSLFNMEVATETIAIDDSVTIVSSQSNGLGVGLGNERAHMQRVLKSLQTAFAHMDASCVGVYDIGDFIRLLGLPTNVQQDAEEFAKLFLEKIGEMENRAIDSSRQAAKGLFTGRERYLTTCSICGYVGVREQSFQEVEVPIDKGDLEKSIGLSFVNEEMCGDNKYFCEQCAHLTDAVRSREVATAPTILLRLVFGGEEYKLTAVLYHIGPSAYEGHYVCDALEWTTGQWWSFDDTYVNKSVCPGSNGSLGLGATSDAVDAEPIYIDDNDTDYVITTSKKRKNRNADSDQAEAPIPKRQQAPYKVTGLNRASDAYMLAYVKTSQFNRSINVENRIRPQGDVADRVAGISKKFESDSTNEIDTKKAFFDPLSQRKAFYNSIESFLSVDDPTEDFAAVPASFLEQFISGALLEKRLFLGPTNGTADPIDLITVGISASSSSESLVDEEGESAVRPPRGKRSAMSGVARAAAADCSSAKREKGKASKDTIMYTESFDNADMICKHKKGLNPAYLPKCKLISKKAFDKMIDKNLVSMDRTFTAGQNSIICMLCLYDKGSAEVISGMATSIHQIIAAIEFDVSLQLILQSGQQDKDVNSEATFALPKPWLRELKKYADKLTKHIGKGVSAGDVPASDVDAIDPLVNAKYVCKEHGGSNCAKSLLVNSETPTASIHVVSAGTWRLIRDRYSDAISIEKECQECTNQYRNEKNRKDFEALRRKNQIDNKSIAHLLNRVNSKIPRLHPPEIDSQNFSQLYSNTSTSPGSYMIIQKSWLDTWRAYHNDLSVGGPGRIDNNCFRCTHGKSLLPAAYADLTQGVNPASITPLSPNWYDLYDAEIVTMQQWQHLLQFFDAENADGVEIISEEGSSSQGSCIFQVKLSVGSSGLWEWTPEVCQVCLCAKRVETLAAKLSFVDTELKVVLIEEGAPLPNEVLSALSAVGSKGDGASQQRAVRSKRVTSRSTKKSHLGDGITVSSTDHIYTVRLKVMALYDVEPASQELYGGSKLLVDDTMTLGDYGILSTSVLYVRSSQPRVFTHREGSIVLLRETGFTGTFLSSSLPVATAVGFSGGESRDPNGVILAKSPPSPLPSGYEFGASTNPASSLVDDTMDVVENHA